MVEQIPLYLTQKEVTELIEVMELHINDSLRFLETHDLVPNHFEYLTIAKNILDKLQAAQGQAAK